ncbi:MAG: hypothetical protein P4L31_00290 [Candidatus Babeliales bacterium]|nr:hypothetical protein [Candidatus Babeliales bacterium]
MNFKTTILALSLFTISCQAASITIQLPPYIECQVPAANNRWGTYKTMFTGAMVGGSMGMINYATDFIWPFNWLVLSALRTGAIDNITDDARSQGESINYDLLSSTAWMSDWVAYILMCRSKNMH